MNHSYIITPSYDESSVPDYDLPDPLVFEDGQAVVSPEQWTQCRRAQILEQFRSQMFGRVPEAGALAAGDLRFELIESDDEAMGGLAIRKQVRIHFTPRDDGPKMDLLLYLPNYKGTDPFYFQIKGPSPLFFGMNFEGNHTVAHDPAIRLPRGWVRNDKSLGVANHRASETSRGALTSRWPIEAILQRGYGLATVYYGDLDPDFDDGFANGIHPLLDDPSPRDRPGDAWGSIAAWAWGYSRMLDFLETDSAVDVQRVIAIGHSRLAKTALWAAAQDERFAMAMSNNSGCGGAALSRRRFGETIYAINERFPHWFCQNFHAYNEHESQLPFDQHALLGLIAPRPVYVASAQDDRWADPRGEFLACMHASYVYELLGKQGISADTIPQPNAPLHAGHIGYHLRTGGHDLTAYDWKQYMDYADRHLPERD